MVRVGNLVRYSYCAVAGLRRLGESEENVDVIQGQGKVRGFLYHVSRISKSLFKVNEKLGNQIILLAVFVQTR